MLKHDPQTDAPSGAASGGVFRPDPEIMQLLERGAVGLPSLEALLDWLEHTS